MDALLDVHERIGALGHQKLAHDIALVQDALRCMLELTATGDVLYADELRNILNIRHSMPARRGSSMDPMAADRLLRRMTGMKNPGARMPGSRGVP